MFPHPTAVQDLEVALWQRPPAPRSIDEILPPVLVDSRTYGYLCCRYRRRSSFQSEQIRTMILCRVHPSIAAKLRVRKFLDVDFHTFLQQVRVYEAEVAPTAETYAQ